MKIAYFIFQNTKPCNAQEMLNPMIHFCQEHELDYSLRIESGTPLININGQDFLIQLNEQKDGTEAPYWTISCLIKKENRTLHMDANF